MLALHAHESGAVAVPRGYVRGPFCSVISCSRLCIWADDKCILRRCGTRYNGPLPRLYSDIPFAAKSISCPRQRLRYNEEGLTRVFCGISTRKRYACRRKPLPATWWSMGVVGTAAASGRRLTDTWGRRKGEAEKARAGGARLFEMKWPRNSVRRRRRFE